MTGANGVLYCFLCSYLIRNVIGKLGHHDGLEVLQSSLTKKDVTPLDEINFYDQFANAMSMESRCLVTGGSPLIYDNRTNDKHVHVFEKRAYETSWKYEYSLEHPTGLNASSDYGNGLVMSGKSLLVSAESIKRVFLYEHELFWDPYGSAESDSFVPDTDIKTSNVCWYKETGRVFYPPDREDSLSTYFGMVMAVTDRQFVAIAEPYRSTGIYVWFYDESISSWRANEDYHFVSASGLTDDEALSPIGEEMVASGTRLIVLGPGDKVAPAHIFDLDAATQTIKKYHLELPEDLQNEFNSISVNDMCVSLDGDYAFLGSIRAKIVVVYKYSVASDTWVVHQMINVDVEQIYDLAAAAYEGDLVILYTDAELIATSLLYERKSDDSYSYLMELDYVPSSNETGSIAALGNVAFSGRSFAFADYGYDEFRGKIVSFDDPQEATRAPAISEFTRFPTPEPTFRPTNEGETRAPTTAEPTNKPTMAPTAAPTTAQPTASPNTTLRPTVYPTLGPTSTADTTGEAYALGSALGDVWSTFVAMFARSLGGLDSKLATGILITLLILISCIGIMACQSLLVCKYCQSSDDASEGHVDEEAPFVEEPSSRHRKRRSQRS